MQEVSQAWKDAQEQTLVPESWVEVSLNVGDPDAQADASSTANDELENLSDASTLVERTEQDPELYAMLEFNSWGLDATREIVPDEAPYGENGYIGDVLSGDDGSFGDTVPTITIMFSEVFTTILPGITVAWGTAYDEWASSFRVTSYNGDTQVFQTTVSDNTAVESVVSGDITGYNKIVVEVLKWCLPHHRARIQGINIGIERVYSKAELMSYEHIMTVDPLSGDLPKMEITFEVSNLNGEYNPDNPQGVEKYIMERQQITARYGYKLNGAIEWIPAGVFYMSEWTTPQNGITATFKARDGIEYMNDLYTGPSTGTLLAIATAAFQQAGLPNLSDGSVPWQIDSSLGSIQAATGADLTQHSMAEVIQFCANAACCVFYQDRNGVFHVEPLATGETDYPINQFNSYANSELSLTKQLKGVDINNGVYSLSVSTVGDIQQISNPLISAAQAPTVAQWIASYLTQRKELSGDFRADPRLDPLDRVQNQNRFSESVVLVTEIDYTYNGAFRGSYAGRAGV